MKTFIAIAIFTLPCLAQTSQPSSKPASYTYNGRKVSQQWVDGQWGKFRHQICVIDGKVVDIGATKVLKKPLGEKHVTGESRFVQPKTARITNLEDGTATVNVGNVATVTVAGVTAKGVKVGGFLPYQWLVCTDGGSYAAFEPISKEAFRERIGELKLVEYVAVSRVIPPGHISNKATTVTTVTQKPVL